MNRHHMVTRTKELTEMLIRLSHRAGLPESEAIHGLLQRWEERFHTQVWIEDGNVHFGQVAGDKRIYVEAIREVTGLPEDRIVVH